MELSNAHPTIVAVINVLKSTENSSSVYEKQLSVLVAAKSQPGQRGISRCTKDLVKILSHLKKAEVLKHQLIQDMTLWIKKYEAKPEDFGDAQIRSPLLKRSGRKNQWF